MHREKPRNVDIETFQLTFLAIFHTGNQEFNIVRMTFPSISIFYVFNKIAKHYDTYHTRNDEKWPITFH